MPKQMRILDLFCGAGGAAMGYHQAFPDAEIVGVDIDRNALEQYPFYAVEGDAYNPPVDLDAFDLIHASPPCQAFSVVTPDHVRGDYPDDVQPMRDLIGNRPHVIENVRGAKLNASLMLCGSMFGLQVQRHRYFEHNLGLILAPACDHTSWEAGYAITVTGHTNGRNAKSARAQRQWRDLQHGRDLMGMPWVERPRQIAEAIPPAYTRYIGEQSYV